MPFMDSLFQPPSPRPGNEKGDGTGKDIAEKDHDSISTGSAATTMKAGRQDQKAERLPLDQLGI